MREAWVTVVRRIRPTVAMGMAILGAVAVLGILILSDTVDNPGTNAEIVALLGGVVGSAITGITTAIGHLLRSEQ